MKAKTFAKGVAKGGGAFALGFVTQTVLKAATGAPLSLRPVNPLAPFNPLAAGSQTGHVANLGALVGSLVLTGIGETAKKESTRTAAKIIGYSLLGGLGALESLYVVDPPGDTTPVGFVVPGVTPSTQYPIGETPPTTLSHIPPGATEPASSFYSQARVPTGANPGPKYFF